MSIMLSQHIGQDGDIRVMSHTQKHYVAKVCGVSLATVNRWLRKNVFPEYAARLIAIEAGYFPWHEFDGWKVAQGKLYTPQLRDGFSPAEIEMIPWIRDQLKHLQQLNDRPAQYLLNF